MQRKTVQPCWLVIPAVRLHLHAASLHDLFPEPGPAAGVDLPRIFFLPLFLKTFESHRNHGAACALHALSPTSCILNHISLFRAFSALQADPVIDDVDLEAEVLYLSVFATFCLRRLRASATFRASALPPPTRAQPVAVLDKYSVL